MNEAETRSDLIDPQLARAGWGIVEDSKILRERNVCKITDWRILGWGKREKPLFADYILVYKWIKLAVVEAKSSDLVVGEWVAQAKEYAEKLSLDFSYSANGKEIYEINLKTWEEKLVDNFLSPEEMMEQVFPKWTVNEQSEKWRNAFWSIPFEDRSGTWSPRYYQEIAVRNMLNAVANNEDRILLTLATGTWKTAIAFQIAWKMFHARWNLQLDWKRRPRILFLADRNILANQAFNSFSAFQEDALVRIAPDEIKKKKKVPTNGSIFFTIFQTFMSWPEDENWEKTPYFGEYPEDFFDLIIIDECHRWWANDEGNWRKILEYFSPAVQLWLTATPRRQDNVDTYNYFGKPVYTYSLKDWINDGFLTPFKVKRIKTTLDDYIYTDDDSVVEWEIELWKNYESKDFNTKIEIIARERYRVHIFMEQAWEDEKTIVFCATQEHAALVRDLINQNKKPGKDIHYCVRVTAHDWVRWETFLNTFQDNEKLIPTILTTSQKLSTWVDARNVRNIVLMRPVNSMIEFKQIVWRWTRMFEWKDFFTIYDFEDAYHHFADPEWDWEPADVDDVWECSKCGNKICTCEKVINICKVCNKQPCSCEKTPFECEKCWEVPCICKKKVRIELKNWKELELQYMVSTSFWDASWKPISSEEFLNNLFWELPNHFKSEDELRQIWSNPETRNSLLKKLALVWFWEKELETLQRLIKAEKSDIFDVLEYVFNSDIKPITRSKRVQIAKTNIFWKLENPEHKEFIDFVLDKYIDQWFTELSEEKLAPLLLSRYKSLPDAISTLWEVQEIKSVFVDFQKELYAV